MDDDVVLAGVSGEGFEVQLAGLGQRLDYPFTVGHLSVTVIELMAMLRWQMDSEVDL